MLDTRPFRTATFRHLAAAYWINELGNVVVDLALAILVYDRTKSAWATATLFLALRFAPAFVAQLLTSRLEALSARRVLPALNLLEAAIFAIMAIVSRNFTLPGLLVLAAADGAFAITARALTRSANANHLMGPGLLREGNGLLNIGTMVANAVGPALGGLIVAWNGLSAALLVDAFTFLIAAALLATAPELHIESDGQAGARGRLRSGLREIRRDPLVLRVFVAGSLALVLGSIPVPIDVIFAKHTLRVGDTGYGLLLASWGVGMVLGGALFTSLRRFRVTFVLFGSVAAVAVGYGGLAASPTLAAACIFSVIGGTGNGTAGVTAITAVQEAITLTAQSTVMALLESLLDVMPAVGFALGGAITALSSTRTTYLASALGITFVLILATVYPFRRLTTSARARRGPEPAGDRPVASITGSAN